MANAGLVLLGILMIVGMFFFSNVIITPSQKSQIELLKSACSFSMFGIPIGQIGQSISPEIAQQCKQYESISQILSFEYPVYGIGFLLFVLGLILGGSKKEVVREVIRPSKKEEEEESEEDEEKKFCTNCGKELHDKDKFCRGCGKKIKI